MNRRALILAALVGCTAGAPPEDAGVLDAAEDVDDGLDGSPGLDADLDGGFDGGGGGLDGGADTGVDGGAFDGGADAGVDGGAFDGGFCPSLDHAYVEPVGGACFVRCHPRYADCDETLSNGCEVDLTDDLLHCGGCGDVCGVTGGAPHQTAACVDGACALGCEAGWGDCNSAFTLPDGCEIDLSRAAAHCGVCHNPCDGACVDGRCVGELPQCAPWPENDGPIRGDLASDGDAFLATYLDRAGVWVAPLDALGRRTIAPRHVAVAAASATLGVAHDGSRYWIAYDQGDALVVEALDARGLPLGESHRIAGDLGWLGAEPGVAWLTFRDDAGQHAARVEAGTVRTFDLEAGYWPRVAPVGTGAVVTSGLSDATLGQELFEWRTVDDALRTLATGRVVPAPPWADADLMGHAIVSGPWGAMAVVQYPSVTLTQVFDAAGAPAAPRALPVVLGPIASLTTAPDGSIWHASLGSTTGRPTIFVDRLGRDGRHAVRHELARPRGGFVQSIAAAANDTRLVVLWRWSSFPGSPHRSAIESAAMRLDGTLERPCD